MTGACDWAAAGLPASFLEGLLWLDAVVASAGREGGGEVTGRRCKLSAGAELEEDAGRAEVGVEAASPPAQGGGVVCSRVRTARAVNREVKLAATCAGSLPRDSPQWHAFHPGRGTQEISFFIPKK